MDNILENLANNDQLKPLTDVIDMIMELDEKVLNEQSVEMINGAIGGALTPQIRAKSIQNIVEQYEAQGLTRADATRVYETFKSQLIDLIESLGASPYKKQLLNGVFNPLIEMFEEAMTRYHTYDIELPILLEDGAQMPTYAHESDVAADIYSLETITIPAHSISNKVRTGLHLQLPENWQARILPRSSIGAKTPLRLSNSTGIIDTGYTGEMLILFDNISDSDYTIEAGDRIAQMWVEPVYRFKPVKITELNETDRNADGFGSSGK